jgi:cellulose biosynthesis protein BcsQ
MIGVIGLFKGGSSKSLLTANLAVARALDGRDVLAIDADAGQNNLYTFMGMREAGEVEPLVSVSKLSGSISKKLDGLRDRYDDILVDCGGYDSQELRSALTVADRWLLPICPSYFQLLGLPRLRSLLIEANVLRDRFGMEPLVGHILGARLSSHPIRRENEMERLRATVTQLNKPDFSDPDLPDDEKGLTDIDLSLRRFEVLPSPVTERYYWRDGEEAGLSVLELKITAKNRKPLGDAQIEVKNLYAAFFDTGAAPVEVSDTAAVS